MGKLELYIPVGRERLRCGYTTGTCAAAAAAGAAALLLEGAALPAVHIDTPAGVRVEAHRATDGLHGFFSLPASFEQVAECHRLIDRFLKEGPA